MEPRRLIIDLVPRVTRNASVRDIDEHEGTYRITIVGTTGVEARCEIASETVEAAVERAGARTTLERALKSCADRTVAEVPDGRG